MYKSDYDYVVETKREYHPDDGIKRRGIIHYDVIAESLCIVVDNRRWPVKQEVKEKFKKEYKSYVTRRIKQVKPLLGEIVFQGNYNPINLPKQAKSGKWYFDDRLKPVLKSLPKLNDGEKYAFLRLQVFKTEMGFEAHEIPM